MLPSLQRVWHLANKPWLQQESITVNVQVSEVINRPVEEVFQFHAHDHVRNHPRWDLEMEVEQIIPGLIGVGTVIRRRNSHSDTPVERTIEVVNFEPNWELAVSIHDGPVETHGWITSESTGPDQITVTIIAEFPGMVESADTAIVRSKIERTASNMKNLVESEISGQ